MKTPKYKALVYLSKLIVDPNGVEGIACLETRVETDKQAIVIYCKMLLAQGFIQAYRVVYSPQGDDSWYNDAEVFFLPHEERPIFVSMT
jgi:hypothetical protein